jgi:hypothetical protein
MALSLRAPGGKFDAAEARRALEVLCDPLLAHELRGLPSGASVILPGKDTQALAAKAEELSRTNNSVYLCLNPVALDCRPEKAVKDEHVARRRWLMVDVDPVKPAEHKDDPATDGEKAGTLAAAGCVRAELGTLGWPEPVVIDSGNGTYLLYRVDMEADERSRELCRGFLHRLAERMTGPKAKIDRATHNAGRIAKLPGALSKKRGARESAARPFRLARLLSVPNVLACVTEGQVGSAFQDKAETLTEDVSFDFGASEKPPEARVNGRPGKSDRLKAKAPGRTSGYGRAALNSAIQRIRGAVPGGQGGDGRNDTYFREVAAIAELVAGGEVAEEDALGELRFVAEEVGLQPDEVVDTFNSAAARGAKNPRAAPGRKEQKAKEKPRQAGRWRFTLDGETVLDGDPDELDAGEGEGEGSNGKGGRLVEMLTLGRIYDTDFPEPTWVVPGIMSEGLNIVAGAPKKGKSLLALNLALTIAGGGEALGKKVLPGGVLYLSLEDKHRRVKSRALKMLRALPGALAGGARGRLTVATSWPRQDEGGLKALELWRVRAEAPTLFIIDTWARWAPAYRTSGSTYSQDSEFMAEVQAYANRHRMTAVVIHHTRKAGGLKEPEDYVQEVSGTLGLSGVADGILVLMRSRQDDQASLHITGRDVQEQELVLQFAKETLTWTSLGTKEEHTGGRVRSKVIDHLKGFRGKPAFPADVAESIEEKLDSVKKALSRLYADRIVRKVGYAYAYPGEAGEESF